MTNITVVSRAYARYIRVSPRKVRQVIDLVRGEKVGRALATLASINKGARVYVEKLVKSAVSNAKLDPQVLTDELFISKITADGGPMLKRFRAAAMGRATMIRRRSTHLRVELASVKKKGVGGMKKVVRRQSLKKVQKRRVKK
jgi:large subunit ribosomal protein L22